jgi:spore coat protein H
MTIRTIARRVFVVVVILELLAMASLAVQGQGARPAGWTEASHGAKGSPNYALLFAMDKVHELRIAIPADQFKKMQEDVATVGPPMPPGMEPGGRGGFDPQQMQALMEASVKACEGKAAEASCGVPPTTGNCLSMFGGPVLMCVPPEMAKMARGGALSLTTRDPMYVPVTVTYNGSTWTNVAMRYKGNSSLATAIATKNGKVPFRLDFNRFAKADPRTSGQRFHGFQEMTFSSNFTDDSQLREALGNEIFRDRGVPAPRSAFYRIYVDAGAGPVYWGLYTMVEDPGDGAMLDSQLGGRSANLYKPDGPGADFTRFDKEGFSKKTNEDEANFADVEAAIAALQAPRNSPVEWRLRLESVFDVDHFLRWLAVNTAIDNWDTYGAMAHNYYLYGDPRQKGRLMWIPWDNNMAFGINPMAGPPPGRAGGPGRGFPPPGAAPGGAAGPPGPPPFLASLMGGRDLLHRNAGDRWPLLQKVMADDVYAARYRTYLTQSLQGAFEFETFARRARQLHAMITPYVTGPQGERPSHTTISSAEGFKQAIDGPGGLLDLVRRRQADIREALAK